MKTPRRDALKYLIRGAVLAPVAGLGIAVGLGPSAVERQRKLARAENIPLLPEDLHHASTVSDAENAALPLRALTQYWADISESESHAWENASSQVNKHPEDMAALMVFLDGLEQYPEIFELVEEAARRPHCDFQYDGSQGFDLMFSEFAVTRSVGRLLAARAQLAAIAENTFADIARIARLGNLLWETPVSEAFLTGATLQSLASNVYVDTVRRFGPSPIAHKVLAEFHPAPDLTFSFQGDVVFTLIVMKLLREGKLRTSEDSEPLSNVWNGPSDLAFFARDYWEERVILYWREFYAILRSTKYIDERVKRMEAFEERLHKDNYFQKFLNLVASILGPHYGGELLESLRNLETKRSFRETALQLLETKAATGAFPTHPTPARDPYSGKPLLYRREEDGCVFWSVGPNRKDDGGVELSSDKKILDLVVRL
ncbi:MAG: hypothetical protein QM758_21315 [Armatimonas sp.]